MVQPKNKLKIFENERRQTILVFLTVKAETLFLLHGKYNG
jgi:hypothetical protein